VTAWANERYAPGHVETLDEYLNRGGVITRVGASVSADRLDWPTLMATVLGESADDIARGFAWSDVDREVRDAIDGADRGSLVFEQQETW
jgi:hypothetical protein